MIDLGLSELLLLTAGAVFAGFVDSIAGGGGIITVPLLLAAGLPPHLALGTNKLQASFGSLTAALRYRHGGLVSFRALVPGILFTLGGAILGTIAIQLISAEFLNRAIPLLLLGVFLYTLFSPRLGEIDVESRLPQQLVFGIFGLSLGFYDGFFGPGTGSFWTIALAALAGFNLRKATATTKVMNFTSNIVSLSVFVVGGNVVLGLGLMMGTGQLAGAWIGSHLVLRRGTRFIRVFFLIVVAATITRLFLDRWV